jgi:hypothetical protein
MMIAWPDQWYHTSGDRIDKADPTQLKRIVVIAAGAAFTVANADDDGAIRIAGEVTSNATRRLGHQFIVAQETLNRATTSDFNDTYKMARIFLDAAIDNEKKTLQTVLELAEDRERVGAYVDRMVETVDKIGAAHFSALETHMQEVAKRLRTSPAEVRWTDLEKKASQLVPRPTVKVKENGYRGYSALIDKVPGAEREKYPYENIASTGELQLLIDGERSVLDIKNALDAQYPDRSELQSVLNYIQILELAGLVEM